LERFRHCCGTLPEKLLEDKSLKFNKLQQNHVDSSFSQDQLLGRWTNMAVVYAHWQQVIYSAIKQKLSYKQEPMWQFAISISRAIKSKYLLSVTVSTHQSRNIVVARA
jgi:hypothetical protein